jgi:hypothetical protein
MRWLPWCASVRLMSVFLGLARVISMLVKVQKAVDAAVKRFGGIDVCVNNASAIMLSGVCQCLLFSLPWTMFRLYSWAVYCRAIIGRLSS